MKSKAMKLVSSNLASIVKDWNDQESLYLPGPYWKKHSERLVNYLESRNEIANFRSADFKPISAFAGSPLKLDRSYRARFWALHQFLSQVPLLGKFLKLYEDEIKRLEKSSRSRWNHHLRCMYQLLLERDSSYAEVSDQLIGGPPSVEIEKRAFSQGFLEACLNLSDIERRLSIEPNSVIVELGGGGYGALAEIIVHRYPGVQYIIADLPPIAWFSEYYLKKIFPGKVRGMQENIKDRVLDVSSHNETIFIVPNYMVKRVAGPIDLFINEASFQEMTTEIVSNYATIVKDKTKNVYLNNAHQENRERPGLNTAFYKNVFAPLAVSHEWQNPLHPGYRKLLLSPESR